MFLELIAHHRIKIKFALVGIWNTFFGYGIFIFFDSLFSSTMDKRYIAYMSAMILSNILAIVNAFILHKYMTFKSKTRGMGIIGEFIRFAMTYLFSIVLSIFLLPLFVEMFHMNPKIGAALIILISTFISYIGHSRFSFRHKHTV